MVNEVPYQQLHRLGVVAAFFVRISTVHRDEPIAGTVTMAGISFG